MLALLAGALLVRGLQWGALGAMLAMTLDELWRMGLLTRRFVQLRRDALAPSRARARGAFRFD